LQEKVPAVEQTLAGRGHHSCRKNGAGFDYKLPAGYALNPGGIQLAGVRRSCANGQKDGSAKTQEIK
jgi:hypothetical protein